MAKWRNRFVADRVEGLLHEVRPGRPRVIGDDRIEALITATLESTRPDATRWSTRSMAAYLGLSQSMVSRVWRAFGLAPHKQDSWKLSEDPLLVDTLCDVVGLYLDAPGTGGRAVQLEQALTQSSPHRSKTAASSLPRR